MRLLAGPLLLVVAVHCSTPNGAPAAEPPAPRPTADAPGHGPWEPARTAALSRGSGAPLGTTQVTIPASLQDSSAGVGLATPSSSSDAPRQQAMANSVRLRFVGDVIFGRYVDGGYRAIATPGENPFSLVDDLLVGDVVVANLETPLVEVLPQLSRQGYFFGADRAAALHLAGAGFTHVSLANNHSSDLGAAGLRETPRILSEHGIDALGAARSHSASLTLDSFEVRGFRVGFLAVTARLNFELPGELQVPFVKTSEFDDRLGPLLEDADGSHDLLVVLVHWGTEYSAHPDQQQRVVARRLLERGADLVIGHHPHVLQEIEVAEAGLVAYSLGNFLFENTSPDARLTGVLGVDVEGDGRCDVKVSFHPAVQRREPFHPEPATDFVAEAARQRILPKSGDARQRWAREGESLVTRFRRRGCSER